MAAAIIKLTQAVGGEGAPDFVLMSVGNWGVLGWELIPSWIRRRWANRRKRPNGHVAATIRRYRIQHGEGACRESR